MKTFARYLFILATFTNGLLAGSPAIDRDAPDAPPHDQLGYNRVGVPDVGAFQFGELPATIPSPPIARPATYIASNSFTANWTSVSGATVIGWMSLRTVRLALTSQAIKT
jgi:hypothetical protein